MDCEIEINELKERIAKLENRLEDVKAEVKLFLTKWNATVLVCDDF